MKKRFAIFDMDGTLVDSMPYWRNLAVEFLAHKGVTQVSPAILEQIRPMTMRESARLFLEEYGLSGTVESITAEMNAMIEEHYRRDIPLKLGVLDYLQKLHTDGVQMCVASATAEPLMELCLSRLGVLDFFSFLLSCETVNVGKNKPDVYHAAANRFGATPPEIAVYEDALYAVKTAQQAGYYVVGVYDASGKKNWEELLRFSAEQIYFE